MNVLLCFKCFEYRDSNNTASSNLLFFSWTEHLFLIFLLFDSLEFYHAEAIILLTAWFRHLSEELSMLTSEGFDLSETIILLTAARFDQLEAIDLIILISEGFDLSETVILLTTALFDQSEAINLLLTAWYQKNLISVYFKQLQWLQTTSSQLQFQTDLFLDNPILCSVFLSVLLLVNFGSIITIKRKFNNSIPVIDC